MNKSPAHTPTAREIEDALYARSIAQGEASPFTGQTLPLSVLYAAAPDMLAVLEAAEIVLRGRDQTEVEVALLTAMKAAIAKART